VVNNSWQRAGKSTQLPRIFYSELASTNLKPAVPKCGSASAAKKQHPKPKNKSLFTPTTPQGRFREYGGKSKKLGLSYEEVTGFVLLLPPDITSYTTFMN